MGKLRFSKGIKTFKIKKTIGFKLGNTTVRVGAKGVSTSTKICKGVRYTTFSPIKTTNNKNNKQQQKNNNIVPSKTKKEKIKNKKTTTKISKTNVKYSYENLRRRVTSRRYTEKEKMDLIIAIGQSGLPVEQRVKLISLIKTK